MSAFTHAGIAIALLMGLSGSVQAESFYYEFATHSTLKPGYKNIETVFEKDVSYLNLVISDVAPERIKLGFTLTGYLPTTFAGPQSSYLDMLYFVGNPDFKRTTVPSLEGPGAIYQIIYNPQRSYFGVGYALYDYPSTLVTLEKEPNGSRVVYFNLNNGLSAKDFVPEIVTFNYSYRHSDDIRDRLYATVAAVPEPSTYAMLGLGLGLLGVAAHRRKS